MRIYLAGSARNARQFHYVRGELLKAGHTVHDWTRGPSAYSWAEVGVSDVDECPIETMRFAKNREPLRGGLLADVNAIHRCNAFVLLLPAGADAHFEAGFYVASAQDDLPFYILTLTGHLRASQFYALADNIFSSTEDLLEALDAK